MAIGSGDFWWQGCGNGKGDLLLWEGAIASISIDCLAIGLSGDRAFCEGLAIDRLTIELLVDRAFGERLAIDRLTIGLSGDWGG